MNHPDSPLSPWIRAASLGLGVALTGCGAPAEPPPPVMEVMTRAVADLQSLSVGHEPGLQPLESEASLPPLGTLEQDYVEATSLRLAEAERQWEALSSCEALAGLPATHRLGSALKNLGVEWVTHYVETNRLADTLAGSEGALGLAGLVAEEVRHQEALGTLFDLWTHDRDALIEHMGDADCNTGTAPGS